MKILIMSLLPILGFFLPTESQTGTIAVEVPEVKVNKSAKVIIRLFNSKDGFPSEGAKAFKEIKLPANSKVIKHEFTDIPFGTYAVSVMLDENNNGEMDRNWIGMPKEPVGASNMTHLGKPSFKKCAFELASARKELTIKFIND
ncbi:MAG: DUF2141 domain-containing protein [Bacteroidota bacterium]